MNAIPSLFILFIGISLLAVFIYLVILIIRALLKYIHSADTRKKKQNTRVSLGETIKSHRLRCQMTQEFVAETIGVSRQAVSKWENGSSDPSTSNLVALAKLFKISPEQLLHDID